MYTIVRANSAYHLEKVVNEYISEGYRPIGGVSVYTADGRIEFFQAMLMNI